MTDIAKAIAVATVEFPAAPFFLHAAPLLEEEQDAGPNALIADIADPCRVHWSCAGS